MISDVVFRGDEELKAEGITYGFLMRMQQLGVIAGVEAARLTITMKSVKPDNFARALISNGRALLITDDDPAKELKLHVYQLTSIGRQIMQLGAFEPHEGYLRSVGKVIRALGFKVQIARWRQLTEIEGEYFDAEDLEQPETSVP